MARKRERIKSPNARYVRRNKKGEFNEVEDVGRSLSQDRRRKAKKASKPGQGDKGDRTVRSTRKAGTRKVGSARPSSRARKGRSTRKSR